MKQNQGFLHLKFFDSSIFLKNSARTTLEDFRILAESPKINQEECPITTNELYPYLALCDIWHEMWLMAKCLLVFSSPHVRSSSKTLFDRRICEEVRSLVSRSYSFFGVWPGPRSDWGVVCGVIWSIDLTLPGFDEGEAAGTSPNKEIVTTSWVG